MKTRLEQTGQPTPLEVVADVEPSLGGSSTEEPSAGILIFAKNNHGNSYAHQQRCRYFDYRLEDFNDHDNGHNNHGNNYDPENRSCMRRYFI